MIETYDTSGDGNVSENELRQVLIELYLLSNTQCNHLINFQYMRQQVDQRVEVIETKKKKELVQQIQEKTDAILEEIKAVIGTSGSRTSR